MPTRLVGASEKEVRRLAFRIKDAPTASILTAAGWSVEGHDARHRKALAASRDAEDAARAAAIEWMDNWLRSQLKDGPVPKGAVVERAKAQGIALAGDDPNLTLGGAADRVGVFAAVRDGDRETVYWAISRLPEGYVIPQGWARSSTMGAAMR